MTAEPADRRLRVRIGALDLSNPIICGSSEAVMTQAGILAALRSGAAGVIAKSVNESAAAAAQLDHAAYLTVDLSDGPPRALDASFLCRSGLAQVSPEDWFATIANLDGEALQTGQFVAASIVLGSEEGAAMLARAASRAGVRILELNVGAPHAHEAAPGAITALSEPGRLARTVALVRAEFDGALWVKLTAAVADLSAMALAAREGGADTVVMMGRFLAMLPNLETLEPSLGTCAAYGGRWALPITCRALSLARGALGPDFPLVGTNGARSGLDVARLLLAGAGAVEMTSAVFQGGFGALADARTSLDAWLEARSLTASEIVGRAADRVRTYGQTPVRPGAWRDVVPAETVS